MTVALLVLIATLVGWLVFNWWREPPMRLRMRFECLHCAGVEHTDELTPDELLAYARDWRRRHEPCAAAMQTTP